MTTLHAETFSFDRDAPGVLPAGWSSGVTGRGSPKWSVEADASAPSKPNVLKQSGSGTFPWCVRPDASLADGYVEVKFKPLSGREDQAGGLVWRWKDGDNYYVARANALENNVSLTTLYGRVQRAHQGVLRSIAVGEQVRARLVGLRDQAADPSEREKLELLVNRVNVRIQDLRTMEQVDLQESVSINITVSNNIDLADAIERTVTVVRPLMAVGLAIQAALADQKRAIEAVKATQEYAGDLLIANADAIGRQTEEVGNLTQNATIALAKVEEAHRKVMAAIDKADEIRRAGSRTAEEASAKLKEMSAALLPKVEKLEAARNARLEL